MKIRLVNYDKMPEGFSTRGYESTDGRYYFSTRYTKNENGHLLNWGVLDFKTQSYRDQFCYRRDAVKFAEAGGFDGM